MKLDMKFESILAKYLVSVSWYAWLTAKKLQRICLFCAKTKNDGRTELRRVWVCSAVLGAVADNRAIEQ